MGWERKGKSDYYYRKYRIGDQVFSEYIGRGEIAELRAEEDQLMRHVASFKKERLKHMRAEEKAFDQLVDTVYERNTTLFKALMLMAGCHTHKGEWRQIRE